VTRASSLTSAGPGNLSVNQTLPRLSKRALWRACLLALDVDNRYKMQDSNHWYNLQRSNSNHHTYPMQDPASNTPTLTPAGAHDAQTLPAAYSFPSSSRTAHGDGFYHDSDAITHYLNHSGPSLFPSVRRHAHAFLCTATVLQHEWLSFAFS
jgi:hypothetical protein